MLGLVSTNMFSYKKCGRRAFTCFSVKHIKNVISFCRLRFRFGLERKVFLSNEVKLVNSVHGSHAQSMPFDPYSHAQIVKPGLVSSCGHKTFFYKVYICFRMKTFSVMGALELENLWTLISLKD